MSQMIQNLRMFLQMFLTNQLILRIQNLRMSIQKNQMYQTIQKNQMIQLIQNFRH